MILGMAVAAMVVESEEDSYELYRNRFIIRHTHNSSNFLVKNQSKSFFLVKKTVFEC